MVANGTGRAPPGQTTRRRTASPGTLDARGVGLRRKRHGARGVFAVRAHDPDLRLVEIAIITAASAQEGAVRGTVETLRNDARTVFALHAHGAVIIVEPEQCDNPPRTCSPD